MDRARSDNDEKTLLVGVCALSDGNGLRTALHDRLARGLCQCDLMLQQVGGSQRVVSADWSESAVSDCTGIQARFREYALRESSRWLWLPTLGFSMKNWAN